MPLKSINQFYIPTIAGFELITGRVFANGPGDGGSILGQVILKIHKMILDSTMLNTQHYKVRIKGKVEQFHEKSSAFPYTSV